MSVQKRIGVALFVSGLALCWLTAAALANETKAKTNVTGTWKSSFKTQDGNTIETTYKLKQDGTKVTGTVKGRGGEAKVENGKVEDGKVSFQVTREFNGRKFTIKYHGKVEGDTIKGKLDFPGQDGNSRSFDWQAKLQK